MANAPGQSLTAADATLIADIRDLGFDVSPRQLKELRAKGFIAGPARPGRGRGRGRPSAAYPSGTSERVARICRIRDEATRFSYADLPILLFLDGSNEDLPAAKASALATYERIEAEYPRADDPDGGPEAIAKFQSTASRDPVLRAMRDSVGVGAIRRESWFDRALAVWLNATLGIEPERQNMSDLLSLLDPSGMADQNLLKAVSADMNYHEWGTKLRELDLDDLVWARDLSPKLDSLMALALEDDLMPEMTPNILQFQANRLHLNAFETMMNVAVLAYFRPLIVSTYNASLEAIRAQLNTDSGHN